LTLILGSFFQILGIKTHFLNQPTFEWSRNARYEAAKQKIRSLSCTNDLAERSVRMSSDFLSAAKIEKNYQNVVQVVEDSRDEKPDLRRKSCKRKLNLCNTTDK